MVVACACRHVRAAGQRTPLALLAMTMNSQTAFVAGGMCRPLEGECIAKRTRLTASSSSPCQANLRPLGAPALPCPLPPPPKKNSYDYSGYGCSTGTPTVSNTLADISAVLACLQVSTARALCVYVGGGRSRVCVARVCELACMHACARVLRFERGGYRRADPGRLAGRQVPSVALPVFAMVVISSLQQAFGLAA